MHKVGHSIVSVGGLGMKAPVSSMPELQTARTRHGVRIALIRSGQREDREVARHAGFASALRLMRLQESFAQPLSAPEVVIFCACTRRTRRFLATVAHQPMPRPDRGGKAHLREERLAIAHAAKQAVFPLEPHRHGREMTFFHNKKLIDANTNAPPSQLRLCS